MYTIMGGGAIGYRLARMLKDRGASVTVVELDPARTAWLEGQGLRCVCGDMRAVDLVTVVPPGTKAAIVAGGDQPTGEAAVRRLREFSKDLIIMAISSDEGAEALRKAGADVALGVPEVQSSSLLREVEDLEVRRLSQAILATVRSSAPKGLAIFCHDNPDADTLASAWALQHICEHAHVRAVIHYIGVMNMPQSKELVKILGVKVKALFTAEQVLETIGSHGKLALVDSARPGENNSLPPTAVPAIVVDHHSTNMSVRPGEAYDIRGNVGSTSTLMTAHIINLGIPMDVKLATALFYGIKTDTVGFTSNVSTADLMAAAYLSAYVYKPLLDMFELPPMPSSTMNALGLALGDREVRKHLSIAYLGELPDRSALPVAVDLLMQEEGVQTAVALALVGDAVHLSARNKDKRVHLGEALHLAFKGMGSAGGHASSAGGQLQVAALAGAAQGTDAGVRAVERAKAMLFEALK
jgi:nanoRNase/pAp phosphatase (c-di-AMP/oligoRNAs hydrolase)